MPQNTTCSQIKLKTQMFLIILIFYSISIHAKIILPSVISNHMVLQQRQEVTLWGWTTVPGERLKIVAGWSNDTVSIKAQTGWWETKLLTPAYGGPYLIEVIGHETKLIKDVMIGEVWLASGQSNMEMPVDSVSPNFPGVTNCKNEIVHANNPNIRMFTVSKLIADYPQINCDGSWNICTPENVKAFSATAYFFAKVLHDSLKIPVGIIHASWGGSNAESWISKEVTTGNEKLRNAFEVLNHSSNNKRPVPGSMYNAMIYPTERFTIKGVIWYQGESNRKNADSYADIMEALISDWRKSRGHEFPFYYTQIAPYNYKKDELSPLLMEAQLKTMRIHNTGMAVTNDIGDLNHIHPREKIKVGYRLALWALANDYDQNMVCSGPLYRSYMVKGHKMYISFDYVADGLFIMGKELTCFEIAADDKLFVPAKAIIKGEKIVVSAKQVKQPVAVRFAFSDTAQPNLYNSAGLPASAFRTDAWPVKDL